MLDVHREGRIWRLVWGANSSGRFRAREFFDGLDDADRAKFEALFRRLADSGEIKSKERFVKETGGIWCFKQHGLRIACFFDEGDVVLIHGFVKKTTRSKRSRRELETAARLRERYLEEK
jgi:phage-related protein